jgi:hypothetical protein
MQEEAYQSLRLIQDNSLTNINTLSHIMTYSLNLENVSHNSLNLNLENISQNHTDMMCHINIVLA